MEVFRIMAALSGLRSFACFPWVEGGKHHSLHKITLLFTLFTMVLAAGCRVPPFRMKEQLLQITAPGPGAAPDHAHRLDVWEVEG